MDNQHKKIKVYRDLTQAEVDLMNEAKSLASKCGDLCEQLMLTDGLGKRWLSIGQTDLQKGFMALIRGIAQPTTF